ncbi:hypothetical protein SLEP1_g36219 [Rubroshorea leprosula]|uniref:Late embryogenesis abundant protein LEA-2 subgroup domain-containing protein n=1 Tax=Rubroshorea leprosula TaxID=152421 RepID=A0AAV5KQV0_9ROSI|nr:hypothetical protein SLEP1_g36219 [Rubroshorea leprosula]
MTEKKEQVRPFAPLTFRTSSDEDEVLFMHSKHHSRKRFILCCGCLAALLLILVVVILVLIFTVFQIEEPMIRMNSVTVQTMEEFPNGTLRTDVNVTLLADVSVKNPNAASFRIANTTTKIYYGSVVVGEAGQIEGVAKARRTLRRNVTVDIVPDKLRTVPRFKTDFTSKALNIISITGIAGKVKILGILKKNIVVKVNCTMTFNVSSRTFQGAFHGEKSPFCMPCPPDL